MVVLSEPLIDDDLCLLCRCEPFGVEHFVGCCQSNANQSPNIKIMRISRRQLTQIDYGRSAVLLQYFAAVEMTFEIEMIVDCSMN
jgi:hypothetical protein